MEKSKDIIEQLKKNEKPFGLMSEEMRKKAVEIGRSEFQCYMQHGVWLKCFIEKGEEDEWRPGITYRLRDTYEEPEPEIREMEISANMSNCLCMYNDEGMSFGSIATVHERPDFIGFEVDGWIWGRVYKNKKSGDMFIKIPANQIDDYEVCDMTQAHVLFRKGVQKDE